MIFDGSNVWVTEAIGANRLRKLNANGAIAANGRRRGSDPAYMVYDGANIWVPNFAGNSITVVQASTGAVVATIASNATNRLSSPLQAAFDGERILVTNSGNDSVTLFRAADLSLIGNVQLAGGLDTVRRVQRRHQLLGHAAGYQATAAAVGPHPGPPALHRCPAAGEGAQRMFPVCPSEYRPGCGHTVSPCGSLPTGIDFTSPVVVSNTYTTLS